MAAKMMPAKRRKPRRFLIPLVTEDRKAYLEAQKQKARANQGHWHFMQKCAERLRGGDMAILRVRYRAEDRVPFTGFFQGLAKDGMVLATLGEKCIVGPEEIHQLYEVRREDCALIVVCQAGVDTEFSSRLGDFVNPESYLS